MDITAQNQRKVLHTDPPFIFAAGLSFYMVIQVLSSGTSAMPMTLPT
jgi:hypothetical protein